MMEYIKRNKLTPCEKLTPREKLIYYIDNLNQSITNDDELLELEKLYDDLYNQKVYLLPSICFYDDPRYRVSVDYLQHCFVTSIDKVTFSMWIELEREIDEEGLIYCEILRFIGN